MNIRVLEPSEFPFLLREIPDLPKRLYARGTLPDENAKLLCVVGSRRHTEYGKAACEKLIGGLSGTHITIVSGLALGIDGIAHRAAIDAGLASIAVPGSGLDPRVLYPRSHLHLAENIVENGGCLLSEFDPETPAAAWTFPQRNRIMAGLSHAVLLIEAEAKSGTLITARLATDYNRELLAVPGSIFSRASEGTNQFLRLGATLVRSSEDILDALGMTKDEKIGPALFAASKLSPNERLVAELLSEPYPRDVLIRKLGMETQKANILLAEMEIKGIIVESLGEIRLA